MLHVFKPSFRVIFAVVFVCVVNCANAVTITLNFRDGTSYKITKMSVYNPIDQDLVDKTLLPLVLKIGYMNFATLQTRAYENNTDAYAEFTKIMRPHLASYEISESWSDLQLLYQVESVYIVMSVLFLSSLWTVHRYFLYNEPIADEKLSSSAMLFAFAYYYAKMNEVTFETFDLKALARTTFSLRQ